MSFSNSSSLNDFVTATRQLVIPNGFNLESSINRTLTPSSGAIAYDVAAELLYFGTTDEWIPSGTLSTTGQTGSTGQTGVIGFC